MNTIKNRTATGIVILSLLCFGCGNKDTHEPVKPEALPDIVFENETEIPDISIEKTFEEKIAEAALEQVGKTVIYDPAYVRLEYPMGDIPLKRGVCTDVVIRALRKVGIDLQKEIHEDMKKNFSAYPRNWGLKKPDPNIDHRRVPNITAWLKRKGYDLTVSFRSEDYLTGDIVTWKLKNKRDHIGIVSCKDDKPLIIHNIGSGVKIEDCLMSFTLTGRYRLSQ